MGTLKHYIAGSPQKQVLDLIHASNTLGGAFSAPLRSWFGSPCLSSSEVTSLGDRVIWSASRQVQVEKHSAHSLSLIFLFFSGRVFSFSPAWPRSRDGVHDGPLHSYDFRQHHPCHHSWFHPAFWRGRLPKRRRQVAGGGELFLVLPVPCQMHVDHVE